MTAQAKVVYLYEPAHFTTMPTTFQIYALSYLQDMPLDRSFRSGELPVKITGGELRKLSDNNFIEVVGKHSRRGHNTNIWKVTKLGKMLVAKQKSRIPSRFHRQQKRAPCQILAGGTKQQAARDESEVAAYLSKNPGAKIFDVALECHMGDGHATRLVKRCRQRCHG
jgi:hypothetical protein